MFREVWTPSEMAASFVLLLRQSESESCSVVSDSLRPQGLYSPWNSLGQNTGVGSLSLLQGIFPTQGLNPGLPHCRQILYQLSHKGSLRQSEHLSNFSTILFFEDVVYNCVSFLEKLSSIIKDGKIILYVHLFFR